MKVLLTGGGTGGHITPILAVAHELKQLNPECQTIYVGERGSKFAALTKGHAAVDEVFTISAGKLRRYHGESWLRRLFDLKTNLLNIRDLFRTSLGIVQAWRLLGKIKPDVVFLKGGFVGVPVGLAAAFRRLPIVTHDSDALPGLANRIVSRWARVHATALPAEYYPYPTKKIYPVGVLVEPGYQPVDAATQDQFKTRLGLTPGQPILLVTGGSSGAIRLNEAFAGIADALLQKYPNLRIIHQVGKGKLAVYNNYQHDRLQVLEFLTPMYEYMGAADIVIARASANTLAELGVQGKATIAVPSPYLTGGHQLKNAERLKGQGAAIIVEEEKLLDPENGLRQAVEKLMGDSSYRHELGQKLQTITPADASKRLAELLTKQISYETTSKE